MRRSITLIRRLHIRAWVARWPLWEKSKARGGVSTFTRPAASTMGEKLGPMVTVVAASLISSM